MAKLSRFIIVTLFLIAAIAHVYSAFAKEGKTYERIISLTPATTEILFELGLDEEIAGVSTFCNYPEEAKDKEKVGSFSNPNIEKIIMLKPDLVILTGMEQAEIKGILKKCNIDYIVSYPKSINDLLESIERIGILLSREYQSRKLIKKIKNTVSNIQSKIKNIALSERPKVYIEIWHDPIMSAGANSFVNDMIELAGGVNVTSSLKRAYSKIDPEHIIYNNPDVVILAYMKNDQWVKNEFQKRVGWSSVSAIEKERVYADIDPDLILRPGPRIGEGLIELYMRLYESTI